MNNAIKKISASVAFFLIVTMLLLIGSHIFMPKNNQKEFGMQDTSANGILGEKSNSIDVLVLGDSEAYCSISPMQMWQEHGFTSYVCATSAQYLSYSESLLRQAFENQSPKLVILETNAIYRKMKFDKSVMTVVEDSFSIFKYHDRWKNMNRLDFFGKVEYTWTDDFKGYTYNTTVLKSNNINYMIPTNEVEKIELLNKAYVKKIAEYCKEHSAELLLVSTPSTKNWNYKKHNGVAELAKELDVKYLDLNMEETKVPIDWSQDTRDSGDHLNYYGAVKNTEYLGNYIAENYSFPDKREDKAYIKWNESLERYLKKVK